MASHPVRGTVWSPWTMCYLTPTNQPDPLSNAGNLINLESLFCYKPCDTVTFKPPVFATYEEKQEDKENVFHFKSQGNSVCQKVEPPKSAPMPQSTTVDYEKEVTHEEGPQEYSFEEEVGECEDTQEPCEVTHEEYPQQFSFEEVEHCDTSVSSSPENVVELFKQEDKEIYGPSIFWKDSFKESQTRFEEVLLARRRLEVCAEYTTDVYEYLREAEIRHQPLSAYMRKQPNIDLEMRSILVDWMADVIDEFKMENETLYLAVSLIDRFLSTITVTKSKFQLLGTASILIAAKYEETPYPDLEDLAYITDDTYNKDEIRQMEQLILKALDFKINVPTINYFLHYICGTTKVPKNVICLAQYLCELTLFEGEPFFQFLPSQIACSAVSLSNYTMGLEAWGAELENTTGYKLQDFSNVIDCLYVTYRDASLTQNEAIRRKYKANTCYAVSRIPAPEKLHPDLKHNQKQVVGI